MLVEIICPQCRYSVRTEKEKIPVGAIRAHCPRCRHRFDLKGQVMGPLKAPEALGEGDLSVGRTRPSGQIGGQIEITCPQCRHSVKLAKEKIPPGATGAVCPRCRQRFDLKSQVSRAVGALEERQDDSSIDGSPGPEAATAESEPAEGQIEKRKAGWVSPQYCLSQSARLDVIQVAENKGICLLPDHPALDAYKMLRTQIYQRNNGAEPRTWMVTSALPGEGKTLTAINLALTLAREYNRTVLLVDCDFRKQAIHGLLGLPSEKSLVDYLVDDTPLCDLIIWPGIEKLTVISGNRLASEGAELITSPRMRALVQEMKERYEDRIIIFDVPPILTQADATAFLPLVESVLLVVQAGSTAAEDIQRAVDLIPKEKLLGFVFNRTPSR